MTIRRPGRTRLAAIDKERDPIELSRRLVYLAAERNLTSWIRTALALMALGFVIDRFGLILDMLPATVSHARFYPRLLSTWAGSALIGMGVLMTIAAAVRFACFDRAYHHGESTKVRHGLYVGTTFSALLAIFGVFLIILLTAILQ